MGGSVGLLAFFLVPETYGPILQQRANRKRRLANNPDSLLEIDFEQSADFHTFVRKYMVKPVKMLCFEPMVCDLSVVPYMDYTDPYSCWS